MSSLRPAQGSSVVHTGLRFTGLRATTEEERLMLSKVPAPVLIGAVLLAALILGLIRQ